MYAAVDIGGTKTLLAALNNDGVILEKIRFETPKNYDYWVHELRFAAHKLAHKDFKAGGIGSPGKVDDHGKGLWFGNLPWKNVPILHDVEKIVGCPFIIENDAKMAALSEAMLLKHEYKKVLYITVSTGIGYGLVANGQIDNNIGDGGGKKLLVEYRDKLVPWESFASGHAIAERYGKPAHDINDDKTWRNISRDITKGLIELIAVTEPEVIVFGGSVGTYFDRYKKFLQLELKQYQTPLVNLPDLRAAKRPEEAVLFGCYDLAKQVYGRINHANAR